MQKLINISSEFYEINDIEINSKKSELLVLNSDYNQTTDSILGIKMGESNETVHAKRGKKAIRHLGVWISENRGKECNEAVIKKEVAKICKVITWKRASVSQLVYLNNSVLMPSIEYRLQTVFLSKTSCEQIQKPIWTLIKNKLGLARSAPNSICSHMKLLGLRTIWQNQIAHYITELTVHINRQDEVGITTRLRIKEAQLKYMSSDNILSSNSKLENTKLKFNLAYRIICEAKKIGFSFQESSAYEDNIEIAGTSILSLLEKKEIARYRESNYLNIFVLEQLISREGNILLTWQQVRDIRSLQSKG